MHPRQPLPPKLARHALPRRWLMTDPRMGDGLWDAVAALPRGSGVILRHYGCDRTKRQAMLARLRRIAARRQLMLVIAGRDRLGRGAAGTHGRHRGALTTPVHSRMEAIAALRAGARLIFASPVHSTRSHPGAPALGPVRLGLMIRELPVPVIALGGMNERRWRALRPMGVYGWAGIDSWTAQARRPR